MIATTATSTTAAATPAIISANINWHGGVGLPPFLLDAGGSYSDDMMVMNYDNAVLERRGVGEAPPLFPEEQN